ncbi:hypothetical protein F511_16235 [Dorcoceras hygrometricum]|uniref:BHLH domain-containing protein n=1 Tax=Dorcoceras hygrometricum TaxID=472368 RepID=A0A2Z7BMN1_9LAMI|nr:hypothetical protein F511_16235 [Dorcoceras hygrometricum]
MELLGAAYEGEWGSFNGTCDDEEDFMSGLLRNQSDPYDRSNFSISSCFWPAQDSIMAAAQGDDVLLPFSSHEKCYPMAVDYGLRESKNDDPRCHSVTYDNVLRGDHAFLYQETSKDSVGLNENLPEPPISEPTEQDRQRNPRESSKRRLRMPSEVHKNKRNIKMKIHLDGNGINNCNNIDSSDVLVRRSTSSCSIEDDSVYGSQELYGGFASSSDSKGNGRGRASRGSATDPQSLYARKRREKINERLRILQGLVPNGTKVDISTMLEEAVEYVKFLQLQIKLLSSDELWMYAPIAYNGMGIGLDLRTKAPKSQES